MQRFDPGTFDLVDSPAEDREEVEVTASGVEVAIGV
jgi:hypothetical protein